MSRFKTRFVSMTLPHYRDGCQDYKDGALAVTPSGPFLRLNLTHHVLQIDRRSHELCSGSCGMCRLRYARPLNTSHSSSSYELTLNHHRCLLRPSVHLRPFPSQAMGKGALAASHPAVHGLHVHRLHDLLRERMCLERNRVRRDHRCRSLCQGAQLSARGPEEYRLLRQHMAGR